MKGFWNSALKLSNFIPSLQKAANDHVLRNSSKTVPFLFNLFQRALQSFQWSFLLTCWKANPAQWLPGLSSPSTPPWDCDHFTGPLENRLEAVLDLWTVRLVWAAKDDQHWHQNQKSQLLLWTCSSLKAFNYMTSSYANSNQAALTHVA